MDLQKLINYYLDEITDRNYGDRTIERYKCVLGVFYECTAYVHKVESTAMTEYLNGISIEKILNTVDYYIDTGRATSEYTVRLYISVLSEFFKFIKSKYNICNDAIIKSFGLAKNDKCSFFYQTNEHICKLLSDGTISPGGDIMPLSDEYIEVIVNYCDDCLNDVFEKDIASREYHFNRCIKALALKLTIYLGLSVERIDALEYGHLDINKGIISINGYSIHLPYRLRSQFEFFVKKICRNKAKNDPLLSFYNGKKFEEANVIGNFIKTTLSNCCDVENKTATKGVIKYAIIQLIDAGVDRDTIIELTGFKDVIFDSCRDFIEKVDMVVKSNILDKKLKTIRAFDFL